MKTQQNANTNLDFNSIIMKYINMLMPKKEEGESVPPKWITEFLAVSSVLLAAFEISTRSDNVENSEYFSKCLESINAVQQKVVELSSKIDSLIDMIELLYYLVLDIPRQQRELVIKTAVSKIHFYSYQLHLCVTNLKEALKSNNNEYIADAKNALSSTRTQLGEAINTVSELGDISSYYEASLGMSLYITTHVLVERAQKILYPEHVILPTKEEFFIKVFTEKSLELFNKCESSLQQVRIMLKYILKNTPIGKKDSSGNPAAVWPKEDNHYDLIYNFRQYVTFHEEYLFRDPSVPLPPGPGDINVNNLFFVTSNNVLLATVDAGTAPPPEICQRIAKWRPANGYPENDLCDRAVVTKCIKAVDLYSTNRNRCDIHISELECVTNIKAQLLSILESS